MEEPMLCEVLTALKNKAAKSVFRRRYTLTPACSSAVASRLASLRRTWTGPLIGTEISPCRTLSVFENFGMSSRLDRAASIILFRGQSLFAPSAFFFAQRACAALRPSALLCSGVIFANRLAPSELKRFDRANCPRMLRISFSLSSELQ